ncbi:MAG TPA: bifunctional phosphoribosylaminoimidazolecarboxamide formyltransferase/IMP cyclohydrolase [Thermoleophilia bacterium]|nr:bifunctional phosphoribosylaminoimidazolecarboxamide formyltransferase/IMP cyclohydrolase [Acidobacteriota bacterium]HQJ27483.1 bifunctional phosphoribosylaminoimidazolecarboxamide formyltransferase/IMP cyclohydrolase [Thermoleophilia bacterium]
MKVKRALISVFNKSGVEAFAKGLTEMGVTVISTGGTAKLLKDSGIPVTLVEEVTGFPEMLDGRVKTMHPRLMAGVLARRDVPGHMETIAEHDIEPIDMVVCSLYPFEEVAGRRGVEDQVVIENIDIGGPSMIRAAAKNHAGVAVVTSHEDYDAVLDELRETGELKYETLRELATRAFHRTAHYDFVIANWFSEAEGDFPDYLMRDYRKVMELKYGENPHQRAAYYSEVGLRRHLLSRVTQLHGKQLGFNNLYDLDAARAICDEFTLPCVTIIKHNNPCGCALAENLATAYDKALACDPVSAFGSVIAVNRAVDVPLAERLAELFVEVLFAPDYDEAALEILSRKADIRILRTEERRQTNPGEFDHKRVSGGILVQDMDGDSEERDEMTVATRRHPTEREWGDMIFAFRVAKHVKSNAIVLAKDLATVGVGAGQMSRVDSTRIAIEKARSSLDGAVVGSDAFFPFADAVELAIGSGVSAFMQPGGSKGDEAAVAACDEHGAAMVFTGRRHFLH